MGSWPKHLARRGTAVEQTQSHKQTKKGLTPQPRERKICGFTRL